MHFYVTRSYFNASQGSWSFSDDLVETWRFTINGPESVAALQTLVKDYLLTFEGEYL